MIPPFTINIKNKKYKGKWNEREWKLSSSKSSIAQDYIEENFLSRKKINRNFYELYYKPQGCDG